MATNGEDMTKRRTDPFSLQGYSSDDSSSGDDDEEGDRVTTPPRPEHLGSGGPQAPEGPDTSTPREQEKARDDHLSHGYSEAHQQQEHQRKQRRVGTGRSDVHDAGARELAGGGGAAGWSTANRESGLFPGEFALSNGWKGVPMRRGLLYYNLRTGATTYNPPPAAFQNFEAAPWGIGTGARHNCAKQIPPYFFYPALSRGTCRVTWN